MKIYQTLIYTKKSVLSLNHLGTWACPGWRGIREYSWFSSPFDIREHKILPNFEGVTTIVVINKTALHWRELFLLLSYFRFELVLLLT